MDMAICTDESVVEELLGVILNDVCSRTHWDIATRRQYRGSGDQPGMKGSGPHFDICTVLRTVQAPRVLANYCIKDGHAEVLQLACAEQQASGLSHL